MNPVGHPERTDRSTLVTVLLSIAAAVFATAALQRTRNDSWGYVHLANGGLLPKNVLLGMLALPVGMVLAIVVSSKNLRSGPQALKWCHWMLVTGTSLGLMASLFAVDERTGLSHNVLTLGFLVGVALANAGSGAIGMMAAQWFFQHGSVNPWPAAILRGLAISATSTLYAAVTHFKVVNWVLRRWLETSSGVVLRVLINLALVVGSILAIGFSTLVLSRTSTTSEDCMFVRSAAELVEGVPGDRVSWKQRDALLLGAVALAELISMGVTGTLFSRFIASAKRNYASPTSLGKAIQDQALLSAFFSLAILALAFKIRNRKLHPGVAVGVAIGLSMVVSETVLRTTAMDWRLASALSGTFSVVVACSVFSLLATFVSPSLRPFGFGVAVTLPPIAYSVAEIVVRLPSLESAPLLLGPIAILFLFLAFRVKAAKPIEANEFR